MVTASRDAERNPKLRKEKRFTRVRNWTDKTGDDTASFGQITVSPEGPVVLEHMCQGGRIVCRVCSLTLLL